MIYEMKATYILCMKLQKKFFKKINDKYDDFDADDFFTQTCIRFSIGKITVFCYW